MLCLVGESKCNDKYNNAMLANIAKVAVRTYSLLKVQSQLTSLCHECLIQMTHAASLKADSSYGQSSALLSKATLFHLVLFCCLAEFSIAAHTPVLSSCELGSPAPHSELLKITNKLPSSAGVLDRRFGRSATQHNSHGSENCHNCNLTSRQVGKHEPGES